MRRVPAAVYCGMAPVSRSPGVLLRSGLAAAAWAAAALLAWLAFSWTALGWTPAAALAGALGLDAWRAGRAVEPRAGLGRPGDGHTSAAYAAGVLAVAQAVGYNADWMVQALLAAAAVLKAAALLGGARRAAGG